MRWHGGEVSGEPLHELPRPGDRPLPRPGASPGTEQRGPGCCDPANLRDSSPARWGNSAASLSWDGGRRRRAVSASSSLSRSFSTLARLLCSGQGRGGTPARWGSRGELIPERNSLAKGRFRLLALCSSSFSKMPRLQWLPARSSRYPGSAGKSATSFSRMSSAWTIVGFRLPSLPRSLSKTPRLLWLRPARRGTPARRGSRGELLLDGDRLANGCFRLHAVCPSPSSKMPKLSWLLARLWRYSGSAGKSATSFSACPEPGDRRLPPPVRFPRDEEGPACVRLLARVTGDSARWGSRR